MKLKAIVGTAVMLVVGNAAIAMSSSYNPPERVHCWLTSSKQLACEGFNRQYLVEDTYTADLTNQGESLHFHSGAAYFTPKMDEASVFFTYRNSRNKIIKLKTISTAIRPDLNNQNWKKVKDGLYTCNAGYMACPLTNLSVYR